MDITLHTFHSPQFESVVEEALEFFNKTPIHPLPPQGNFFGVGVYALYYAGSFERYEYFTEVNNTGFNVPIYVGKAVPPGWRTSRLPRENARSLSGRLREHARNIEQSENLDIQHFRCRFMLLSGIESDLVTIIEAQMIRQYVPLWNSYIDGFGNHDPGKGRYNQACSEWDALHPGRLWATRLTGICPDMNTVLEKIERHKKLTLSKLHD